MPPLWRRDADIEHSQNGGRITVEPDDTVLQAQMPDDRRGVGGQQTPLRQLLEVGSRLRKLELGKAFQQ